MTLSRCLLVLSLLVAVVSAQIPEQYQRYWYKVNEMGYLHITADAVREMPSGASGKVVKFADGMFLWDDEFGSRMAFVKDGELLVKNMAPNPPAWLSLLKYQRLLSRGAEVTRKEIDALARVSPARKSRPTN